MSAVTVTITGHLAATPELRTTKGGTPVTDFRVIGTDRYFDQDFGDWADGRTTAIRVTAWGDLAEHVVATLATGHHVTVTGSELETSPYTHRETGELRAGLELTANRVTVELDHQTAAITKARRRPVDE
ncbi:single-stranded DNA-binding protein [Nocardia sp. NPDC048505]|uniref:single-stranded DNA-binding protein n=1 Tax=Nocardia sp. NPDC048505 TaxID=3155756 RepID=UPI0033E36D4B